MFMTKEEFIVELNKDLEWEYAAAVQYVQHAATITGAQYDAIGKELLIHSNEEMIHAQKLSDMISDLGGVPVVDVEERKVSSDSKTMLEQDLGGEELAITRYKERVAQAEELGEYGVRRVLEDILMDEEEHRRDLLSTLGR
ncbi:ferritin-like domain-containing protein [Candidatus Parcubacteria bacterium]|nr:ferritin-like domain-containing protein [Candidatus Parcubacteria bacterium]MBT3949360.1 ferritin-like domain-containing protein [Candidatus Parcubacteria bacterium]